MQAYISMVEKHSEAILQAFEYIWKNPETGYQEFDAVKYNNDGSVTLKV